MRNYNTREGRSQKEQKFFASFFQKGSPFFLLLATLPAHGAATPDGAQLFAQNCAICHQPDGAGAIGLAPALAGTLKDFANTAEGKTYLSQILISGMAGSIYTQGHKFSGLMPPFADKLGNDEIAAVLAYVLQNFNGVQGTIVTAQDVAAARARNPSTSDTHHIRVALRSQP
jgi:mono/diheme cytochrome c family protein